jgi:hypothetical protein
VTGASQLLVESPRPFAASAGNLQQKFVHEMAAPGAAFTGHEYNALIPLG